MPRVSAFRGNFTPNKRPYVVLTPDAYVSIQGETSVITCGECKRKMDVNKYLTGIQVDASIDQAPGSATVNLSIPDNDVNDFYADGQFLIIPMMEIELFAKGYYTVGGFPQYYRIFWGIVSSISKNWSNGVTTITLSCKDILRWWELTLVNKNPAFLDAAKTMSGYQLFGNAFAGMNPYTVIIMLAQEAMGDFSITQGSFTSFRPEDGPEGGVIGSYAKDIMTYWQLKFSNIWNSLVLYGTSGQAYTFAGTPGNVSPLEISKQLFQQEAENLNLNPETALFKIQPNEIAAFKTEISRGGDVEFQQNEMESKLSIAITARDQAGYEFYCDTTGDIVFKPPFYNLNVMPNKPVSWINDFEVMDDSITDSEQEVFTHVTSSGNAFGGTTDWGLNDDNTTPRTGVIDWHLLKRYGWRHLPIQLEWAGNPRKLFYHLLDYIDRINSKRQGGTVTIPLRPELRMGFPIWFPKYDSFFYVQGVSHSYSPGGQATSVLNLTAKRSKFIAPKNIGSIEGSGSRVITTTKGEGKDKVTETTGNPSYTITFPSDVGQTSGLASDTQEAEYGGPAILRDPKTGKLLGFPNAVMVYRTTLNQEVLARILQQQGSTKSNKPKKQDKKSSVGPDHIGNTIQGNVFTTLQSDNRAELIDRLRMHRYEAGMTNAGAYDYAHDVSGEFKEFSVIPADKITWTSQSGQEVGAQSIDDKKKRQEEINKDVQALVEVGKGLQAAFLEATNAKKRASKIQKDYFKNKYGKESPPKENLLTAEDKQQNELLAQATQKAVDANTAVTDNNTKIKEAKATGTGLKKLSAINVMVRPVSDEFGFEVIGHYRYGRGVFIDRGKVQLPDPNSVSANPNIVNQLGIQFAAHGGLLTDNPTLVNLGTDSTDFAAAFEQMQPDDYATGATFKGANYDSNSKLDQVNPTGQQTYSDSINNSVTGTGKAVFAEADALRRATTLGELKPTLATGLDEVGFEKCGCQLGKTEWLSVLPQEFIAEILKPVTSITHIDAPIPSAVVTAGKQTAAEKAANDAEFFAPSDVLAAGLAKSAGVSNGEAVPDPQSTNPVAPTRTRVNGADQKKRFQSALQSFQDPVTTSSLPDPADPGIDISVTTAQGNTFSLEGQHGFFEVLRRYLEQRFTRDYDDNAFRERYAISGGRDVVRVDERPEDNNILGDPSDPLFQRAAAGDPDALKALAQGANFNFGKSQEALNKFQADSNEEARKLNRSLGDLKGSIFHPQKPGSPVSAEATSKASAPQVQPRALPLTLPTVLNPSAYPDQGSSTGGFNLPDSATRI